MESWLKAALDYIPEWIEYQMRQVEQPGAVLAVAYRGKLVLERAFGLADLDRGTPLTPRHRFRVASHSKTFTTAGLMRLREQGKLRLDDLAGRYVAGLHPTVARATVASSSATAPGSFATAPMPDSGTIGVLSSMRPSCARHWPSQPSIPANTRFKYSNHAFGLAGLIIEALAGEAYGPWIRRTILEPAGLEETLPDMPIPRGTPMASGHSMRLPLSKRLVIPGRNPTRAMAPATGFVATAGDLARFFGQLDPEARRSVLTPESRREMTRRHWRVPHYSIPSWYGLGTMSGNVAGWDWFGHGGAFQGFLTRSVALPGSGLSFSLLTNAIDGPSTPMMEGVLHILRTFAQMGAPRGAARAWRGRFWSIWRAFDLVPMGGKVLVAQPALGNPFQDACEIEIKGRYRGRIALADGYGSQGEEARILPGRGGKPRELVLGGRRYLPEGLLAAEMKRRYGGQAG